MTEGLPHATLHPMLEDYLLPLPRTTNIEVGEWTLDREVHLVLDLSSSGFHTMDNFQQMSFLDTYVTDPPCERLKVNVRARYTSSYTYYSYPDYTDVSTPIEKHRIMVLNANELQVSQPFGPTIRGLLTAALDAPTYQASAQYGNRSTTLTDSNFHRHTRPKCSMNQLVEVMRSLNQIHTSAIVHRQTQFRITLCGVLLENMEDPRMEVSLPNFLQGIAGSRRLRP